MAGIAREDAHRDEAALGRFKIRRQIDREVAGPPTYNRRFSGDPLSARLWVKVRSAAFIHRSDKTASAAKPRRLGRQHHTLSALLSSFLNHAHRRRTPFTPNENFKGTTPNLDCLKFPFMPAKKRQQGTKRNQTTVAGVPSK
jgi:hypothetical protein